MSEETIKQIVSATPNWYTICADADGLLFVDEMVIAWNIVAHTDHLSTYTISRPITYSGATDKHVAVQSPDGLIWVGNTHRFEDLAQARRAYNGGRWNGLR
jgi:hypothetical protein